MDEHDSMSCHELVEAITDYLEGALPPDDRERLDSHLAGCPGCLAYLDQVRLTIRLTGRVTEDSLPPRAHDELMEAFRSWRTGRTT
jgi:anti-sigma factor (TIGR02949 family)